MGDEWDAEDFEPVVVPVAEATGSKWDGEDADDDVKDSWEDEEEEKKDEEKKEVAQSLKPKAKKLAKIAEKERLLMEEAERKLAAEEAAMTPEERAAEKARRQKLQEENDLKTALETLGISDGTGNLDSFNPITKEDFDEFSKSLVTKLSSYREREEFPAFVADLVKNICLHLNSFDLRNLKGTIENLCVEKSKLEKGDKSKKKGKGKAKLTMESDSSRLNQYSAYGDFEYDDFM